MQVDITFEDPGAFKRAVVGDTALRSCSAPHGRGNLRREQRASVRLSHSGGRQGGFLSAASISGLRRSRSKTEARGRNKAALICVHRQDGTRASQSEQPRTWSEMDVIASRTPRDNEPKTAIEIRDVRIPPVGLAGTIAISSQRARAVVAFAPWQRFQPFSARAIWRSPRD